MKILSKIAMLLPLTVSAAAFAAEKVTVTTLETLPGKTCTLVGDFPGVSASEIRYGMSGNPVTRSVAEAIQNIRDLGKQQGANAVLGIKITMIPLERNRGKEFGDVIVVGSFASCK